MDDFDYDLDVEETEPTFGLSKFWQRLSELEIEELENRRLLNKYYPFNAVECPDNGPVFELIYRSKSCLESLYVVLFGAASLSISLFYSFEQHFVLFSILTILFFIVRFIVNVPKLKIKIEQDGENYFYYFGNQLIEKGKIQNCYIRLRRDFCTDGRVYYYLIFNAYNVEEYKITSYCCDYRLLRKSGKRIAFQLNVNYFDSDDLSINHVVRHVLALPDFMDSRRQGLGLSVIGARHSSIALSSVRRKANVGESENSAVYQPDRSYTAYRRPSVFS